MDPKKLPHNPDTTLDVAMVDWNDLLDAIKHRLEHAVGGPEDKEGAHRPPQSVAALRASVLECVQALDQLQRSLAHDTQRLTLLQPQALKVRAELAGLRVVAASANLLPTPKTMAASAPPAWSPIEAAAPQKAQA